MVQCFNAIGKGSDVTNLTWYDSRGISRNITVKRVHLCCLRKEWEVDTQTMCWLNDR